MQVNEIKSYRHPLCMKINKNLINLCRLYMTIQYDNTRQKLALYQKVTSRANNPSLGSFKLYLVQGNPAKGSVLGRQF